MQDFGVETRGLKVENLIDVEGGMLVYELLELSA